MQEGKLGPYVKRRTALQTELNSMPVMMDPRLTHSKSQELSNCEEHIIRNMWWLGSLQTSLTKLNKEEDLLDT